MRPLTWVLKAVDPVGLHRQSGIPVCSGNLGIVKILRYFRSDKFKIAPHKQKSIVKNFFGGGRSPPPPLANGALCLSTPKHTGKPGTGGDEQSCPLIFIKLIYFKMSYICLYIKYLGAIQNWKA
jgi:hypothetical protein